jgi:hypothetical protein
MTAPAVDFEELARLIVEAAARAPDARVDPEVFTHRLEDLPKELGVLLASVGVLGVVSPGIAGAPALIAGGLVLWPKTFGKVEDWFQCRFPLAHRESMKQVGRFLDDLQRRYPTGGVPRP